MERAMARKREKESLVIIKKKKEEERIQKKDREEIRRRGRGRRCCIDSVNGIKIQDPLEEEGRGEERRGG